MNDKKIYKILQEWFPELDFKKVPKESQRRDFEHFKAWMMTEKNKGYTRTYLMALHPEHALESHIHQAAVLQDLALDLEKAQFEIMQAVQPTLYHYEKNKANIGKNYQVQEQVIEMILSKIYERLDAYNFRMLLIYADQYYWIAVPAHAEKLNKFCKKFEKQFKAEQLKIELFSMSDCLQST
ncbi:hypothetical protein D9K79_00020 [Acinetobacter cumulans]|jgi:hypothetical protein|uniref:Uncharacterized protein n=1 Tax=Acinetobacter cumulans TaxID=2136182 RepID=A0ABX9UAB2_9GAMM|nr:hypothetical protein [Acinetobacter cumulans]RLL50183.1 hypothetical protein D9K79_00020 [Acinetobacter cumulans]